MCEYCFIYSLNSSLLTQKTNNGYYDYSSKKLYSYKYSIIVNINKNLAIN